MAISTNAIVDFFGTEDNVVTSGSAVNDGAFSAEGSTWTNDDDAPEAEVRLVATGTFGAAPDANGPIHLYASKDGEDAPSANRRQHYLGTFICENTDTAQDIRIRVRLPNGKTSEIYTFEIQNECGQTLSATWDLHVTPISPGPHA